MSFDFAFKQAKISWELGQMEGRTRKSLVRARSPEKNSRILEKRGVAFSKKCKTIRLAEIVFCFCASLELRYTRDGQEKVRQKVELGQVDGRTRKSFEYIWRKKKEATF